MLAIAFLTSAGTAHLTDDDRHAIAPLEARGARVASAVWTDASVDYGAFDLVVIRSTWDWYENASRFVSFLESIEGRVRVENARATRWLDKRYLSALASRGVRVVPTDVVRSARELEQTWPKYDEPLVLKPANAAGAHRTYQFDRGDFARARCAAEDIVASGDVALLQPFLREVETDGEWSLVFFDGEFSHAVKKRPMKGDFRVQEEFGGTVESAVPSDAIVEEASRAIAAAGERFLYARVDGTVCERLGGFCVTELEVVEPELFLRVDPRAPERFADAIVRASALGATRGRAHRE